MTENRLLGYFKTRLTYGVVACIICPVLGALGQWHWILDLFSHFRIQYTITLLGIGAALLLLRHTRWGFISCITGIVLSISLLPYAPKQAPETLPAPEHNLLNYNLNTANRKYQEVLEFLQTTNADIVFLMEVNQTWISKLSALKASYPYSIMHPRSDNFGLALYSKHPIDNGMIPSFGSNELPTIEAAIRLPKQTLHLIGTHPLPPVSKENSDSRNQQLTSIAAHIQNTSHDYQIVTGDLNCTPWSFIFKDFTQQAALKDSSIGNGIGGTWFRKLGFISIPIDHILGSERITFTEKEIKDTFGSDHSAVLVNFILHP
ncbi:MULTISPECIES: endonuclease/exonuclease/phosphatase family protein [unclassified Lentimonas]|uniref:endonuclease/exonuclease/phosphatase family protein n=1 Tax=unclassified Lentimonas TaxID=2630993 RepID=UPI001325E1DE|nr:MULTISPECIES: endonuclease/exonuclease/phosphatase family protein [unclassified Lentimonas]CAA6678361.1 Unannotated [Lentimonas sp. CC4]CAA6685453.1 Unannotated [Lentimonas sp. CC6]CAA7076901.1 Unannotated [Lentimonas sp. CC4]CAA7170701.1 Unannotated [Lentimonas sp. CC21]CAA7179737.1 Unannotated [Lentimonas sp. CC8]